MGFGEFFEFAFWPDSGAGFSGLVEGLDEVPGEEGSEDGEADGDADEQFLPAKVLPVCLVVEDEPGDCESQADEHDEEEESFPEDAIDDFLPGVGGDESGGVSEIEPGDGGHPEGGENTDNMDDRGGIAFGWGGFWSVGLEGHAC